MAKEKDNLAKRYSNTPPDPDEPVMFNGIARSVECFHHNSSFKDYRIVTLHIKDGTVEKIERSVPYASFECGSQLDLMNDKSILNLTIHWRDRRAFQK
jgi:hypothetical protein